jgi:hypothetical protein
VGHVPPLTASQKFGVVFRGSFDYFQYPWYGMLAGISQAENSEKGYGQGAGRLRETLWGGVCRWHHRELHDRRHSSNPAAGESLSVGEGQLRASFGIRSKQNLRYPDRFLQAQLFVYRSRQHPLVSRGSVLIKSSERSFCGLHPFSMRSSFRTLRDVKFERRIMRDRAAGNFVR